MSDEQNTWLITKQFMEQGLQTDCSQCLLIPVKELEFSDSGYFDKL